MDLYTRPYKRARIDSGSGAATARASQGSPSPRDLTEWLPTETLMHIFSFLSEKQRLQLLTTVCGRWRAVSDAMRRELTLAVMQRKPRLVFDLNAVSLRFPRLNFLILRNPVVTTADDGDDDRRSDGEGDNDDDSSDDGAPLLPLLPPPVGGQERAAPNAVLRGDPEDDSSDSGSDTGSDFDPFVSDARDKARVKWPQLPAQRFHARVWNDAINPHVSRWASVLTHLELDNIVMSERTTWMRALGALEHVSLRHVAFMGLRKLVAEHLVGSAATLTFLAVSYVMRTTSEDRIDTFDIIFRTYVNLVVLRLDHFGFNRTRRVPPADGVYLPSPPFAEHRALRVLQLQALDTGATIPLHRFRLPYLTHVTLKSIRVSRPMLAVPFPSVRWLQLGFNVDHIETPMEVSLWFPNVAHIGIGQYGSEVDPDHAEFAGIHPSLLPNLKSVEYLVSLARHERHEIALVDGYLPTRRATHIRIAIEPHPHVCTIWLLARLPYWARV
jgi:hypothetical protein